MRLAGVGLAAVLALAGCAGPGPETGAGAGPETGAGTAAGPGTAAGAGVGDGAGGGPPDGSGTTGGLTQVRVLADDSLRVALDQVETLFEVQNPSVEVVLAYGEGIDLARQIAGGEPAEVFVTEDPSAMAAVGLADQAEVFAGGRLSVAAVEPAGEPFVAFVGEGAAQRVFLETGILRP